jgi:hypothetical protein
MHPKGLAVGLHFGKVILAFCRVDNNLRPLARRILKMTNPIATRTETRPPPPTRRSPAGNLVRRSGEQMSGKGRGKRRKGSMPEGGGTAAAMRITGLRI